MSYEQKELSGSIFKNNRKERETHPDLTGTAKINGEVYWVSGWRKEDKNGNEWISLALKLKDFSAAKPAQQSARQEPEIDNDEVPW